MSVNPPISSYDPRQFVVIKGARVHNLKNVDVALRRNSLVVITGLSGSGKSSLAFDTLYSEGQRRYVESLSSYARQFLGRMHKPEVDFIKGISPAIAIEQKVNTRNPRSTVGTSTEIYEYLKLLFARIGKTYSPVSGNPVMRHSVTNVVDHVLGLPPDTMVITMAPITLKPGRTLDQQLAVLMQQGFSRVMVNEEVHRIEDILPVLHDIPVRKKPCVIIDRFSVRAEDNDLQSRVADSVQTAFYEGEGECLLEYEVRGDKRQMYFSSRFELDGITFEEPSVNLFTFNNPLWGLQGVRGLRQRDRHRPRPGGAQ
jgi:excinuclease ABC subunit A